MLFSSHEFIFIFLPLVFVSFIFINKMKLHQYWIGLLLVFSLFFYQFWNFYYLFLLGGTIVFNYVASNYIIKKNKPLLIVAIVANILLLVYFKYKNFFLEEIVGVYTFSTDLLLPLGISFFTFQQIIYLVDNYSCRIQKNSFKDYALFVSFFPQLIAGPIVHYNELIPQLQQKQNLNYENITKGLFLFSIGLFKKVIIADGLDPFVSLGFDESLALSTYDAWIATFAYTFQLYFDFSGYTDMALGIALLFNIKLPINFNSPYKASNIQEFWRRWHITLSNFF